jgi:hypothetical protein
MICENFPKIAFLCPELSGLKLMPIRMGPMAGSCENGNELLAFIRDGESLNQQSYYQLLKENTAPWS